MASTVRQCLEWHCIRSLTERRVIYISMNGKQSSAHSIMTGLQFGTTEAALTGYQPAMLKRELCSHSQHLHAVMLKAGDCCRLDFHRLRRLARWGVVGSSRVAPPTPQELRQLMAPAADKSWRNKWKPKPAESPWAREPRLTVAALQKYRSDLSREKERVRLEQSEGASRNDCK